MIPFIPFLVDTVVDIEEPFAGNVVHEWGVVVFEEGSDRLICGGPWTGPDYLDDACAEAPVVWIHGEPFTGTFTVTLPQDQGMTFTHPSPSNQSYGMAQWNISAGQSSPAEESLPRMEQNPYYGPFEWGLEYWRAVPSLQLFFPGSGTSERFIYYECTVDPSFTGNFFRWGEHGNPEFSVGFRTEALFFTPSGVFPVEPGEVEFLPLDLPMAGETSPDFAQETFCRWGNSLFKSEEITALWQTWRPELTDGGSCWLVFPIPAEYHGEISSLELDTGTDQIVVMERLFLGAVRLNRQ